MSSADELSPQVGAIPAHSANKSQLTDSTDVLNGHQLRRRAITVSEQLNVSVYELQRPAPLVEAWYAAETESDGSSPPPAADDSGLYDPFGVILWPGAHLAARKLEQCRRHLAGATVVVLGAGTGLEAIAAAQLGAASVVACDNNPLTLALLEYAANSQGLGAVVKGVEFDLLSESVLPGLGAACSNHTWLVCSDIFYNPALAGAVGRRCAEALQMVASHGGSLWMLVSDSQRFHGGNAAWKAEFERVLQAGASEEEEQAAGTFVGSASGQTVKWGHAYNTLDWQQETLEAFVGSGILLDEDQTYDAVVEYLCQQML